MGRDQHHSHSRSSDPEDKRASGRSSGRSGGEGPVSRALRRGRSGYGVESLRPHLRDQLVLKDLLRPTWPPPEDDGWRKNKDKPTHSGG